MQQTNPTGRFSNRVSDYIRSRPGYPPRLIEWIKSNAGLFQGSKVADIGSGTGIFSNYLLENGQEVYAVEPNPEMRQAGEFLLREYPLFHSMDGAAEITGLPDGQMQLITCAQAFHWFNKAAAQKEFRRILSPNGLVALIWNNRDTESTLFFKEYESFLMEFSTDYTEVNHKNIGKAVFDAFFDSGGYQKHIFPHIVEHHFEDLLSRVKSCSYMPDESDSLFPKMKDALFRLFSKHKKSGKVEMKYEATVYLGKPGLSYE